MGETVKQTEERYTYADYLQWDDGKRRELIDGTAVAMTPAPSRQHQQILGELFRQIANFLSDKSCEVYIAPFDVRLPKAGELEQDVSTVVQPDLSVVCDKRKLDDKGCNGVPDLVIEIISPESAKRDLGLKLSAYERAGAREYWVVHPGEKTVMIFSINDVGEYGKPVVYGEGEEISVSWLAGLMVNLENVFR